MEDYFIEDEFLFEEHEVMNLGYEIVIGNMSYEQVLDETEHFVIFPFDPTSIEKSDIRNLEEYFASVDDFEKAIILRDFDFTNLKNFRNDNGRNRSNCGNV
jgi:hypothetical protein